jgi:acetyltransferase
MALVALRIAQDREEILGIGRLSKLHGRNEAEIAVVIADRYQRLGLGTQLSQLLVRIAKDDRIARLYAYMLPQNTAMQSVVRHLGFEIDANADIQLKTATLSL